MAASQEVGNLAVKVSMDATGFQNGVSGINKQLAVVQSEFKAASAELGGFGTSSDQLKLKSDSLSQQIDLQRQKVQALEGAFRTSADKKGQDARATQDLQIKLNNARTALAKMESELGNTNAKINDQVSRWGKLTVSVESAQKRLSVVGGTLRNALGFAGGMAIFEGVKTGLESVVRAGIGTNAQMEQTQIAFRVLTGSADAAKQTVQDLYAYAASTPFEFPEIAEAGRTLLTVGLNVKDTITWIGDLAAANPGTTINDIARSIADIKSGNTGEAFARLRDFGISAQMLEGAGLEFDKGGGYKGSVEQALAGVQKIVQDKYGGMADAQSKSFSGMMSTLSDNVNQTIGKVVEPVFNKIKDIMPTVLAEVGKFSDIVAKSGLGAALQSILPPGMVGAFKLFGEIISSLGKVLKGVFGFIKDNGELVKDVLLGVASGFAAFKTISTVISAIEGVKTALASVNTVIGLATSPIGIAVLAIGALVAVGYLVYKNWDTIQAKVQELWQSITTTFQGIKDAIANAWNSVKTSTVSIFTGIADFFREWGGTILAVLTGPIGLIVLLVVKNWDLIREKTAQAWDAVKQLTAGAWENIKTIIKLAWEGIAGILKFYWDVISGIIKVGLDLLTGNWSKAWADMKSIFKNLWNDIKGLFGAMANDAVGWGKDFIQGLINGIKGMIGSVVNVVKDVASTITSFLHFSTPDEGPLANYETWMPDFMSGLAQGIERNKGLVKKAISGLAAEMKVNPIVLSPTVGRDMLYDTVQKTVPYSNPKPVTINFNGSYSFGTKDDIDYFMNKAALLVQRRK